MSDCSIQEISNSSPTMSPMKSALSAGSLPLALIKVSTTEDESPSGDVSPQTPITIDVTELEPGSDRKSLNLASHVIPASASSYSSARRYPVFAGSSSHTPGRHSVTGLPNDSCLCSLMVIFVPFYGCHF